MRPEASSPATALSEGGQVRVLVTGAGGFVGSWLMEALAARLPAGGEVVAAVHQAADAPRVVERTGSGVLATLKALSGLALSAGDVHFDTVPSILRPIVRA